MHRGLVAALAVGTLSWTLAAAGAAAEPSDVPAPAKADFPKPYSPPCAERENVFEFAEKPAVKVVGQDRYEITFAAKANCDVTVGIMDPSRDPGALGRGTVVRHLASGVLGRNAPPPFQKNSLKQTIYWDGKDDLGVYHKTPDKLKVRVMLGLKPTFGRLLGPTSPKLLPGYVWAVAADADGVYVFNMGTERGHVNCRKFDHDAKYVKTLWPPAADLPPEKLGGMGYVEYEPGKRAIQAPIIDWGFWREGHWMPPTLESELGAIRCRPAVHGGRIYIMSSGFNHREFKGKFVYPPKLYYFNTDGSVDYAGIRGRIWIEAARWSNYPHIAVSPDGKWLYFVGFQGERNSPPSHVLLRGPVKAAVKGSDYLAFPEGDSKPVAIVGQGMGRHELVPGSDDRHLNFPKDVACDPSGRVYVTDSLNNRVQVFASDGQLLKTLKVDRPDLVQVHQKTGHVYVTHQAWRQGRSMPRITKFKPFPDLAEEAHWDDISAAVMTLDSWSAVPRLWISGAETVRRGLENVDVGEGALLRVYEENGDKLRLVSDFEQEAREEAGSEYVEWPGGMGNKVVCDPVREKVYWNNEYVFDLATGKLAGRAAMGRHSPSEIAFDKRGYMHIHRGGGPAPKGVVRVDPDRVEGEGDRKHYAEVPYDYGEEMRGYVGALPTPATDTQFYSWGMGVNMRGDVALVNHIGYTPRFQDETAESVAWSQRERQAAGVYTHDTYGQWLRGLAEMERLGQQLFYIRPQPGIPLYGGTIWTYAATGEAREKAGVVVGPRVTGVQMDEDGFVYFTNARRRYVGDKPFLWERGGNFGGPPYIPQNRTPFTGTYVKSASRNVSFQVKNAKIPRDRDPGRPADLAHPAEGGFGGYLGEAGEVWAEGVEWMYAGATGIVAEHCDCPQMRASLDWYKRSFVPEAYRHSVGVLDTNGNLICHVGRYGNFDSDGRPGSLVPPGGDGIALTRGVYVSVTDNYLVIEDWGQRLIVARLNYHVEEEAGIGGHSPVR